MKNRVIIIGGGTSVQEGIDNDLWNKIKNEETWVLNYGFLFIPYEPTALLWLDEIFYSQMKNKIEKLQCKKFAKELAIYIDYPMEDVKIYKWTKDKDVSEGIYIGENGLTGIFAISLAIEQQFKNIFLLGIDYNTQGLYTHWYQKEAIKKKIDSVGFKNKAIYLNKDNSPNNFIKCFDILPERAEKNNCKIFNVSMFSNLYQFEKISYEKMYKMLDSNK